MMLNGTSSSCANDQQQYSAVKRYVVTVQNHY
jgi:hypothetical protein